MRPLRRKHGRWVTDIPCTVGLVGVLLRMHIDRLERVINMCDLDLHQPQPAQLIWALLAAQTKTKFRLSPCQYVLCNHKSAVTFPQFSSWTWVGRPGTIPSMIWNCTARHPLYDGSGTRPVSWSVDKREFLFLWRCDPKRVMASSFLRFLDHTQRRTTVGRTPLDE